MCKKQTAVSHSPTEPEIISLDAGLRLGGIPALDLWDLIVSVLENMTQTTERERSDLLSLTEVKDLKGRSTRWIILIVFTQTSSVRIKKLCCMCLRTTKQWSRWSLKEGVPQMRHVSRTHRVALDWLFDRINLDPQIQIKYIDTKNQLADMLTKGNCTRDEWNHLMCVFNISHFSSTACTAAMAKRSQQDSGEERVTAKSRPMMSLIARVPSNVSSSTSVSPVKKLWKSKSLEYNC